MTFTTATLCASFVLFRGFNTTDAVNTISLLSGFLVIFTGVYILCLSREGPHCNGLFNSSIDDLVEIEGVESRQEGGSLNIRRSAEARRASAGSRTPEDIQRLIYSHEDGQGSFGLAKDNEEGPRTTNGRFAGSTSNYRKLKDQNPDPRFD